MGLLTHIKAQIELAKSQEFKVAQTLYMVQKDQQPATTHKSCF